MDEDEFRFKDLTIHPRQAEILKNNWRLFWTRANNAPPGDYRTECFGLACEAANEYHKITGKEVTP